MPQSLPFGLKMTVTWFGSGLSPVAPGTMGSLATLPLVALIAYSLPEGSYLGSSPWLVNPFLLASLLVFFASIRPIQAALDRISVKDPSWIVLDEVAGQLLAFAFIDPALLLGCPWGIVGGFVLFRFFDILKPFGIKRVEKLPGAWGVMSDDMLGGFYAAIGMAILASSLV